MKDYLKTLLVLLLTVGLASCEDNRGEIKYVIAGRAWTEDAGVDADSGEALFSTFESGPGGFGMGTQFCTSDGTLYD